MFSAMRINLFTGIVAIACHGCVMDDPLGNEQDAELFATEADEPAQQEVGGDDIVIQSCTPVASVSNLNPVDGTYISTEHVAMNWSSGGCYDSFEIEVIWWDASVNLWKPYFTYSRTEKWMTLWPTVHYTSYAWRVRAKKNTIFGSWSNYNRFFWNR